MTFESKTCNWNDVDRRKWILTIVQEQTCKKTYLEKKDITSQWVYGIVSWLFSNDTCDLENNLYPI
jgi:hypothetical protein